MEHKLKVGGLTVEEIKKNFAKKMSTIKESKESNMV
jgi:hypothetical protein